METIVSNPVIGPLLVKDRLRTYSKGQTIMYPDDQTLNLFVIKKGVVAMYDIDSQGNQNVVNVFGPPALFPMVSFTAEVVTTSWFYGALAKTEVYVLSYQDLKMRLEEADGIAAYNLLLRQLLSEVHELVWRITNSSRASSLGKLVTALKFLAVHHSHEKAAGWTRVTFPVSHQLLADMTGLARETVTISMKQLQQYKAVRTPAVSRLDVHLERISKIA